MNNDYYYQQELIELGFSKRSIDVNLPMPDLISPNPRNKERI
jgi:hypothetical protein